MDSLEKKIYKNGYKYIVGIDEAGRGPIAGPLVISAVIFKYNQKPFVYADSKKLSPKERDSLYNEILENALDYSIVVVDNEKIDSLGISSALKEGIYKAIEKLYIKPDYAILDFINIDLDFDSISIPKADEVSHTVAAASILSKITRDRIMEDYSKIYPNFSFDKHKGYPTKQHYQEIKMYGITPIHRKSYRLF
ncbi:ribonuclease HII [Sulfurihydrogenibium azorense Az-Fu1]|uniref:Ribonuclease HII n=1 Tax=Sulfurihydrogenibium azorense (strain DSM 15241 / OCM 825 / Az-Fu1) TaxID=204536 RepID=C1DXR5_SULAA|nr:ribonuclease HII [Sulfurihydrogenibium azorense]ACN99377.1 ribonuclease HII [Sulfurihydrogenibium azorense Az-Fu1]